MEEKLAPKGPGWGLVAGIMTRDKNSFKEQNHIRIRLVAPKRGCPEDVTEEVDIECTAKTGLMKECQWEGAVL